MFVLSFCKGLMQSTKNTHSESFFFAIRRNPRNVPTGLTVITFDEIVRFIVESRANSWIDWDQGLLLLVLVRKFTRKRTQTS